MITFVYDGCHAELQIGDQWAGKLGGCPHCGTNTRVPGYPRRTSKLVILFRVGCIPFAVVLFWALMFSIADADLALHFILGAVIMFIFAMSFLWGGTNLLTFLSGPREYLLWKKGGGDPFFDSIDGPQRNLEGVKTTIKFKCSRCHKSLYIRDAMVGNLAVCPYCWAETVVPNSPMRTSKLTIIGRMVAIPMIAVCAVGALLGAPVIIGGVIGLAVMLGFWWVFTNLVTFVINPGYYRLWKRGGGDPWFDTLPEPLNNDPPSVRFQELYLEKAKKEWEANFGPLPTPSPPPDTTKSIDDPNVI